MQADTAPLLPELRAISFDQRGVGRSRCRDGRYGIDDYLGDIEAIRDHLDITDWHVLGHSWGGLLAQLYADRYGPRVRSLALSSSSLGVGADWKETKRQSFRIELRRAGVGGTLRFYLFGLSPATPDPLRRWGMRHLMTEVWRDYSTDPRTAPDPDRSWLDGCSPQAMIRTDRALARAGASVLASPSGYAGPVLVLYGEDDIFGPRRHRPPALPGGHPGDPSRLRAPPLAAEPGRLPGGAARLLRRGGSGYAVTASPGTARPRRRLFHTSCFVTNIS